MTTPTPTTKTPAAQRLSDLLLVVIVLLVGVMAGAASFAHVHHWTMHNSPTGTGDWFGWANAVISELIPTAALIIIGRRRRTGTPVGYPMFLLIIAVALSLTAQLAVAKPTVFGWMVSALPALAFFALSKLVFTATRTAPTADPAPAGIATVEELRNLATRITDLETRPTPPGLAPEPAPAPIAPSSDTRAVAAGRPAAKEDHGQENQSRRAPAKTTTPTKATPAKEPASTVEGAVPVVTVAEPTTAAKLLPQARIIAQAHRATHGTRITRGQLASRLRIDTDIAEQILDALAEIPTAANTAPRNGTPTTTGAPA